MATPVVRATSATPAAADRLSGSTTTIVYDWRVGTSIYEMLERSSSASTASGKVGINSMRISSYGSTAQVTASLLIGGAQQRDAVDRV